MHGSTIGRRNSKTYLGLEAVDLQLQALDVLARVFGDLVDAGDLAVETVEDALHQVDEAADSSAQVGVRHARRLRAQRRRQRQQQQRRAHHFLLSLEQRERRPFQYKTRRPVRPSMHRSPPY